jgi:hypothetical protein
MIERGGSLKWTTETTAGKEGKTREQARMEEATKEALKKGKSKPRACKAQGGTSAGIVQKD